MTITQLADILRAHQYNKGIEPKGIIDSISDRDTIMSYATCSECGKANITFESIEQNAPRMTSVDEFFKFNSEASRHAQHEHEEG